MKNTKFVKPKKKFPKDILELLHLLLEIWKLKLIIMILEFLEN